MYTVRTKYHRKLSTLSFLFSQKRNTKTTSTPNHNPQFITTTATATTTTTTTTTMQPENPDLYRFLADNGLINVVGPYGYPVGTTTSCDHQHQFSAMQSFCSSSSYYPNSSKISGHSDSSTPHDRALAALKNHKEAEKRRRERINSHLDKLRSLLPCNSKVYISIYTYTQICVLLLVNHLVFMCWIVIFCSF